MKALDAHAHELVALALWRLAQDHPDGDIAMFSALLRAWLGWAGEMHCPALHAAAARSGARRPGRGAAAAVPALRGVDAMASVDARSAASERNKASGRSRSGWRGRRASSRSESAVIANPSSSGRRSCSHDIPFEVLKANRHRDSTRDPEAGAPREGSASPRRLERERARRGAGVDQAQGSRPSRQKSELINRIGLQKYLALPYGEPDPPRDNSVDTKPEFPAIGMRLA